MVIVAAGLIVLGLFFALMGQKLFRILLPLVGFVVGVMVGFGGVQGVFGRGAISLSIALVMALIVGTIMAVLSFMFYDLAVVILMVMLGASVLSYLGVAIGLGDNGFVLLLLSIAGGVLGFILASRSYLSISLVFTATAFLGTALMLAGVFLLVGEVTLAQLDKEGIIPSVLETVDQSFLWLFVWIASAIVAMNAQVNIARRELVNDSFAYSEKR